MPIVEKRIGEFVKALAAKQPTPGGGGAACMAAAIGAAAARMSAAYTTRKKDVESGAAAQAELLIRRLDDVAAQALKEADADEEAYSNLQRSWRDETMSAEERSAVEAAALAVPVRCIELCTESIRAVSDFLPACNPNIASDAKVGIHLLAGAARAAYQTALVNKLVDHPDTLGRLKAMLWEAAAAEAMLLGLDA